MSPEELQSVLESFFKKQYYAQLQKAAGEGKPLIVDFADLEKFSTDAADMLLESPYSVFQAIDAAVSNIDVANIGDEPQRKITVRFRNLPKSRVVEVKNLRSRHIKKLIGVEGIIKQASEVRPQITAATFECKACGERITLLQEEQHLETPYACTCGNRRGFDLVSRKLIDHQRIVIEECPETLIGSAQPRKLAVFLRDDLVDPELQKTVVPGSKVVVTGTLNDSPILTALKQESVKRDIYMEANYLEPIEIEFEEIELSEKDIEQVKELAKNPAVYDLLVMSIAPSIYGYDDVKEAIALQLFGGIRKVRKDGVITRGDIHILLCGDPGCIAGDSQVALLYKGMEKIQNLGNRHLQPIKEVVTKIRKNGKDKAYDVATIFQHYPKQPVLKVVTETGKSITCTYNQPFLTRDGWQRADKLSIGTKIRVMPKIPAMVEKFAPTGFSRVKKKSGHLKDGISLPDKFTPELASLCGYVIGDGNIHPRGYCITCYINNEETDIIEKLSKLWKETFNIRPSVSIRNNAGKVKTINDKNGNSRQFISTQQMHIMEINSRQVAQSLSFLSAKRVPQAIFKSPKRVVAKFISWLFDADGCAFGNGRGRTSIQLKSSTPELLSDVQLLLLYFGIQSRIIGDNLCIRRSHDMELFAKHIGFNSEKKKAALKKVLEVTKNRSETGKRKTPQRYEKIAKIISAGVMDVYDFEVPKSHTFIANGIVCHNSGKSQLLKYTVGLAPKARYVVGKSASGAGITATVVKDEFMRGWALEAGALVLANNGLVCIDELDKMTPDDRSAMHEAMEQQQVTISKANIQATLNARTTILAAANPKLGRFDSFKPLVGQIDLPETLLSRFDLIFAFRDRPDKEHDTVLVRHILKLHRDPEKQNPPIDTELLRKYISYAKNNSMPRLTPAAEEEIEKFYVGLRSKYVGERQEGGASVPIGARQLEAIVRLSEASARVRLSDKVTVEDAKRAVKVMMSYLMKLGVDPETGRLDIDRLESGITSTQRNKIRIIQDIIDNMSRDSEDGAVLIEDVQAQAEEQGITDSFDIIQKMKREGELFEPKIGRVKKI